MLVDVVLVLDELIAHRLLQIGALAAEMSQFVHDVLHKMKAIDLVLYTHVKRGGDRALFLVTPDMQVPVGSRLCQSNGRSSTHGAARPDPRPSGREGAPLGQRGGAPLFVNLAGDEMALLVEMVVDLGLSPASSMR